MKVLMFGWEFPPFNSGGLGTACYGITKALSKKGVEITFVLPRSLSVKEGFLNIISTKLPKVKIKEVDSLLASYITFQSYKRRFLLLEEGSSDLERYYCKDLMQEVERYSAMAKDIALEVEHDVIHVHDWMTFPAGIEANKVSGKPLVAHVHSTEIDRSGGHGVNPQVFRVEREGIKKAERIIAVSNLTKSRILKGYGVEKDKIDVVYNAVDRDKFSGVLKGQNYFKIHNKKIVLFLGRLTLHKGPDYFLYAAKKVLERKEDVIFVIAGTGDMEEQIIEQTAELGISDRVLFTGFLQDDQLREIYKLANLYVMPSVSEPFGITTLEALASGTPVIISKQSGVSEVLNHCLKVDFWDTDEMANKIIAVLENEELEECLASNGFAEVAKFSWDDAAKKIIEIYNQLLGKNVMHRVYSLWY